MRTDPGERVKFDDIFNHPWIVRFANRLNIDIDRYRVKDKLLNDYVDNNSIVQILKGCNLRQTEIRKFDNSCLSTKNDAHTGKDVTNSKEFGNVSSFDKNFADLENPKIQEDEFENFELDNNLIDINDTISAINIKIEGSKNHSIKNQQQNNSVSDSGRNSRQP